MQYVCMCVYVVLEMYLESVLHDKKQACSMSSLYELVATERMVAHRQGQLVSQPHTQQHTDMMVQKSQGQPPGIDIKPCK